MQRVPGPQAPDVLGRQLVPLLAVEPSRLHPLHECGLLVGLQPGERAAGERVGVLVEGGQASAATPRRPPACRRSASRRSRRRPGGRRSSPRPAPSARRPGPGAGPGAAVAQPSSAREKKRQVDGRRQPRQHDAGGDLVPGVHLVEDVEAGEAAPVLRGDARAGRGRGTRPSRPVLPPEDGREQAHAADQAGQQRREDRRPHLHVVEGERPAAGLLRDARASAGRCPAAR